ncbi:hypothetical protein BLNAU_8086 [Blattamonas nauphoetae]|uniref:Uncharacterized protein n=1 Tax=Blattamonas nauphoetae TaxID=2049346 RepID=A0ABQ9XZU4_9EUKA|nr:hypothetical protein BLNAU_8086 [Blattamonas nauphoetae]
MLVDRTSSILQLDNANAKQTNCLEVFLSQICGKYQTLRTAMLNGLLILASESDWALSAILGVEYIEPLERYCEQTQPHEVPITLPQLLYLIGRSSEAECVRICESTIPSFFLKWMVSISDSKILTEIGDCLKLWTSTPRSSSSFLAHPKTQFLAFLDHCESREFSIPHLTILTQLCFCPHLDVSKMALEALTIRSESDSETRSFLRTLEVPSCSTKRSSELVPFAGRLCSTLAERVSEMKSLFTESSPSDGTISVHSDTLPSESPLLNGNAVLELLCEGFYLLCSLHSDMDNTFDDILIGCDFHPLLKSTIVTCLDLLEQLKTALKCVNVGISETLIKILDSSWYCASICLYVNSSLRLVFESTFSDVPQLCSLLERTCCHFSSTHSSHLVMIINVAATLPHMVPRLLEENLVERVIETSKPMTVPTINGIFNLRLVWAINNLVGDTRNITQNKEELKRIRMLKFERVLKPAKQYLQFILQREEFILNAKSGNYDLSTIVGFLLTRTLILEQELFENGEIVESGQEEWEVVLLVEKTKEKDLGERLEEIREDDEKMKKKEKQRWRKRVERLREAGHSDVMEGWLTRMDWRTRSDIVEYLKWDEPDSFDTSETQHRWDSPSPLARSEEVADENKTVECSDRLSINHIPKHIAQTNSRDSVASVHNIDCVADPIAEDKQREELVEHDAACWGADVVGCGEFWDRLAFGEHSELDVIAADAADNQHGAGGGWAGGFDGSREQAGFSSEEIVLDKKAIPMIFVTETVRDSFQKPYVDQTTTESDRIMNCSMELNAILFDETSANTEIDTTKAKQTACLEWYLSRICGEDIPLRQTMLSSLLVLATRSDWALSTILEVDYIKPLEAYCEQTRPYEVTLALEALSKRCKSDLETRSFLQELQVPSSSTDSSSELVTFVGRLCSTLAEHVSEMKSLFAESSPSDGTISALSTTLPNESPLLTENAVLEVLCDGFSLFDLLLDDVDDTFQDILIKCAFVPLLKSTIVACLDLLDHARSESTRSLPNRTALFLEVLDWSWSCASSCLYSYRLSLHPIVESTFSDVPQLCSLLERTCCHFSSTHFSHLKMIINISSTLRHLTPCLLEENLVERVLTTSKPMEVPTTHRGFHLRLIWAVRNLIGTPKEITIAIFEETKIRMLQFERALKPAKQYLQFILQREEFIPNAGPRGKDLSSQIYYLLAKTLQLERDLFEDGEIVETGREEWEVGWLVEKTKEDDLTVRLTKIRGDDARMKKNEKGRWKKRVERLRESGHSDAMEGWLTRMDNATPSELVEYLQRGSSESGVNVRF